MPCSLRPSYARPLPLSSLIAALLLGSLACSSNSKNGGGGPGSNHDGGPGAGGSGDGGGGAGSHPDTNFNFVPADARGDGQGGTPGGTGAYPCLDMPAGTCATSLYKAKSLPTDIFVMFDQSGSMAKKDDGVTMRIDAVRSAVDQFMKAPESNGLGIGIGYFGYQPLMCACTSCDPKDYSMPAVPIGTLPAQATSIMASLNGIAPTGETPTGAAIRGACTTARARKTAEPTHNVIVLLVTDGEPEAPLTSPKGTCSPTLDDAVAAATECASSGINTYVLGVGPSLDNLNKIAAGGGTKSAYLVASGGTAEIVKALGNIRTDAMIPCMLEIPMAPAGSTIDFQKVNVLYSNYSCQVSTFGYVDTPTKCTTQGGSWYYDDPTKPTKINLCGATCEQVKAAGGQLAVSFGCMTNVIK